MAKREKLFNAAAAKRTTLETSSDKLLVALETIRKTAQRGEFYVDIPNADAALQENLVQLGYNCVVKSASAGALLLSVNWR